MLFWLALATLLTVAVAMAMLAAGSRRIRFLRDLTAHDPAAVTPRVSLIVAARDEARNIGAALDALRAQDYPDYEMIIVDDRSSDGTTEIIARRAGQDCRLRMVRIDELPGGWLGKNHALARGAQAASGEILVFADADIVMRPDTLRRAVGHAQMARRDHLAIAPEVVAPGTLLAMVTGAFTLCFMLYARPWKAPEPRSRCFIGIGAFNLVRAQIYRAVGGHARIAMRPDDDIKLGKIIKDAGFSQEMVFGHGMTSVEWYPSLAALARGFEKNTLAGVDYSVSAIVVSVVAQAVGLVWPFVALVCTSGATWALNAAVCLLLVAAYADQARLLDTPRWHALAFPLSVAIFGGILLRATWVTLRDDGIRWRGTHYSLAELRANRI